MFAPEFKIGVRRALASQHGGFSGIGCPIDFSIRNGAARFGTTLLGEMLSENSAVAIYVSRTRAVYVTTRCITMLQCLEC